MEDRAVVYPKFFIDLTGEVAAMDEEAFTPKWPVAPEEQVVTGGEVSLFCRKLYALGQFYRRDVDTMTVECKYTPCEQHTELHWRIGCARAKVDLLDKALWASVRQDFNLWGDGAENFGIALRQGWVLVTYKVKDTLPPGIRFLGGLPGGFGLLGGPGE